MSRCFPFPPPGYERKTRPENLDLLKEAKHKEKKQKKDKERKKDKEKEKKDGGDEKHRDKKDRKEKHKDKKEKHREKEKVHRSNKDKEKSSISEESAVGQNVEISETKLYPIENSQDRGYFLNKGKCSSLLQGQNGGKPSQSSPIPNQGSEESKFVLELDRRIRDEKSRGSQLPEGVDKKDQNLILNSSEEKGDNKNNRVDKNVHPQGLKNEMDRNLMPVVRSKGEVIHRTLKEENGKRLDDKEKYQETIGIKQEGKQKKKSKESHGKEKTKEKKKNKKEGGEKAKLNTENKKGDQDKLKDDGRNNLGDFADNQCTDASKGANNISVSEGNIKKRNDMGTNGFLHESEIRPNKMQRPALHQSMENGTKPEPFRTPAKPSNDKHAVPNGGQVNNKDQLINGMFKARKPSLSKTNPPATAMAIDQIAEASKLPHRGFNDLKKTATELKMVDPIAEASRKSPHPDSKYLAEVLTVPKNMSDWSEYDDQDWLFSEKFPGKPRLESFGEDVCVWSEAVHIESGDVCALPYVIPY